MAVPRITHDELLARLSRPWLEIVPSRKAMPKRNQPPHAHDPSPNVIVLAHPSDKTSLDVCSKFRQKHWAPRFNNANVPTDFAWQILTPGGERLLIFTWVNWLRGSRQMFEEFCRETRHEFGTLTADGTIAFGSRKIALRDCQLVHEEQLRSRSPVALKKKSAKILLGRAESLLKSRKSKYEEIDYREFHDEGEAHDDAIQQELKENFLANMAAYEAILEAEFGQATDAGLGRHDRIPINGQVRHAVWKVGRKLLYLVVSHEDLELPWGTYLGVLV